MLESKNPASKSPVDDFSKAQKQEWINYLIEKVGLSDWKKHKANELSGGQRQRVAIARALVTKAPVILADEPTGALDTTTSIQIMDILKEISKTCLVVMVTHNGELADKYSDRIIKILDGELTHDSNPYEIDNISLEDSNNGLKDEKQNDVKNKQSAMSFWTAFSLSFKIPSIPSSFCPITIFPVAIASK